jgi:putative endopeptidase
MHRDFAGNSLAVSPPEEPMRSFLIPAALLISAGFAAAQQPRSFVDNNAETPAPPKVLRSFDVSAIDKTADPCTDFYAYACGNWRKDNPIPSDQARWGTFGQLGERNRYLLYTELEQASKSPKSALQKQYGDFFAACMNVDAVNAAGLKPMEPTLAAIAALSDKKDLAALIADRRYEVAGFERLGADQDQKDSTKQIAELFQGGLSLPDRDYYLAEDERMTKIRAQYKEYITQLFKLMGDDDAKAAAETKAVLDIETALAKGSMPRVDMRNPDNVYHPMPVSALKTLMPDFDWSAYFAGVQAPHFDTLNVAQPEFFKTANTVIASEPLDALKSYLRFRSVNNNAQYLSSAFDDLHFNFFSNTLQGMAQQPARWKRCTSLTDREFGEAVGQDWVKENFPPEAKDNMEKLVAALKTALASDIEQLPWMSPATKKQAEVKLAAFRDKIGYPDKWRDYSSVEVKRDDLLGDLHRAGLFNYDFQLNHIGKPVDEKEWGMTPPTVNAYYNPAMNDINFPAGILQPPFFDNSKDPAVNFGAIGVVIGHEMTHGFDDEGKRYDAQGNVRDWWTPADTTAFEKRTDCEVKEYGSFEPVPGQKLNGKLTLGENTADNGGIHIAYQALQSVLAKEGPAAEEKKIDGYTPSQRFFIAFAQVWCENRKDEYARVAAKTDPHSPGQFRANGTVENFDQFGKAFGCHVGQPMMPADACRVW